MTPHRYRFTVRSADEAVKLIRERLGPEARVVSVQQVEGRGLARFLSTPKLEVTAEVLVDEEKEEEEEEHEPDDTPTPAAPAAGAAVAEAKFPAPPEPEPLAVEREPEESRLVRLLRAAGISAPVLARLRSLDSWAGLEQLPLGRGLAGAAQSLGELLRDLPRRELGNRIVFLGSPGSGKTTALCKLVALDVFVRQQPGAVLKLDLDSANPGDGLAVFCAAMGVSCARAVAEVPELDEQIRLYVDLPGLALEDAAQIERLAEEIAPLGPTSHVLVVNAAYDAAIIKKQCAVGERIGCTHLVFTHGDELIHWGKLWDVLVGTRLTPLFLGSGQNVAGDLEENVIPAILARTFPALGKEAASREFAS